MPCDYLSGWAVGCVSVILADALFGRSARSFTSACLGVFFAVLAMVFRYFGR